MATPSLSTDPTDLLAVCPKVVDSPLCDVVGSGISPSESILKLANDNMPVYISMVSCVFSCLGSILIITTFICWKDIRSGSRWIITYLSVADFFTAASYLAGSINLLVFRAAKVHGQTATVACIKFDAVCRIQSFFSSWSSMSSFLWTLVLAFYLFWTIVKREVRTVNRLFPFYHLLAWGLPMPIILSLLFTFHLGYSPIAASGWCYIQTNQLNNGNGLEVSLSPLAILLLFVGGKAVEVITYVGVITLYLTVFCNIRREQRILSKASQQYQAGIKSLLSKIEYKLYAIPILFILLRIWGTIQFFLSIGVYVRNELDANGCTSSTIFTVYKVLAVLQAFGDGGQGWANAILYILLSPKIFTRLVCDPFLCCCDQLMGYFDSTWSWKGSTTNRIRHSSSLTAMRHSSNDTRSSRSIPLTERSSLLNHAGQEGNVN